MKDNRLSEDTSLKSMDKKSPTLLKGVLFDLGSTLQEFRHEDWDAIVRSAPGMDRFQRKQSDVRRIRSSPGRAHFYFPSDWLIRMSKKRVADLLLLSLREWNEFSE